MRTNGSSNGSMVCLGGLSEEHLMALCHTVTGRLTINLSLCSGCPNSAAIPLLHQRLAALSAAGLPEGGCYIVIAENTQQIHFRDKPVDRRSFFTSIRNSLFKSAAVILSSANEPTAQRREYAVKRLPIRRELLNRIAARFPAEPDSHVLGRFNHHIAISGSCTTCQGCVAVCPTGALLADSTDGRPQFDQQRCTGCRLCVEFCLDGALMLSNSESCNMKAPE